jgi:hypothetical protein
MKVTLEFKKKIKNSKNEDKDLDWWLTEGLLAAVANSAAGNMLLTPILDSKDYEVVIKDGGKTATQGKRVTINIANVHGKDATTGDDLKEMIESTIFELVNAKNSAAYAKLETDLEAGRLPIMDYGTTKANTEAESSWTVGLILKQRMASGEEYVPSEWGRKQITACTGKANLAAFQKYFRELPHATGSDATPPERLRTEWFYAYNGGVTLAYKDSNKALDKCCTVTVIKVGAQKGKKISLKKLGNVALAAKFNDVNSSKALACARFYHVLMEVITTHSSVKVDFTAGAKANWAFNDDMKECAVDTSDTVKAALTRALDNNLAQVLA